MEDVIRSLKGRVEDGSGSDSEDEEDQDQTEGIKDDEAVDEKRVKLQQAECFEDPIDILCVYQFSFRWSYCRIFGLFLQ